MVFTYLRPSFNPCSVIHYSSSGIFSVCGVQVGGRSVLYLSLPSFQCYLRSPDPEAEPKGISRGSPLPSRQQLLSDPAPPCQLAARRADGISAV